MIGKAWNSPLLIKNSYAISKILAKLYKRIIVTMDKDNQ